MKIKNGFALRPLGREHILVAEGGKLVDFNKIISFNGTAAFLWKKFEGKSFDVDDLASALQEEYEVTAEVATADSARLIQSWKDAGLLED